MVKALAALEKNPSLTPPIKAKVSQKQSEENRMGNEHFASYILLGEWLEDSCICFDCHLAPLFYEVSFEHLNSINIQN